MGGFELRLLGEFEAAAGGKIIHDFPTDKTRALLAYLAVEGGRPHRRARLAGLLWPERPDQDALRNLRKALYRLRHILDHHEPGLSGRLLKVSRLEIHLNLNYIYLDVLELHNLISGVHSHAHSELHTCHRCLDKISHAITLYRGEFMEGMQLKDAYGFEEWQLIQRESLHLRILSALEALSAAYLQRSELDKAQTFTERLLKLEPWHEGAQRRIMRIFQQQGMVSRALAQYKEFEDHLHKELGTEPDLETRQLYERILSGRGEAGSASGHSSVQTGTSLRHFPQHFSTFIGRQEELAQILSRLNSPDCRLLTLMGPGGVGKTRLAIQAALKAAAVPTCCSDGQVFISLANADTPDKLYAAFTNDLDLTPKGNQELKEITLNYLSNKHLLLILDGCETLGENARELVDILIQAPGISLLVTSRHPLNLQAEWLMNIAGLDYPKQDIVSEAVLVDAQKMESYSAIQLVLQIVRRLNPSFNPDFEQMSAIVEICRITDGFPLALEIASSWMRTLAPQVISREIAHNLDFLVSPMHDVPKRHRSMRAVFEHSWKQISPDERRTLAQLSMFDGNFHRDAALEILQCSFLSLATLIDKSLLRRISPERYELHELLRQFAKEKLPPVVVEQGWEPLGLVSRFVSYYLGRMGVKAADLKRNDVSARIQELREDYKNVHQAWRWMIQSGETNQITAYLDNFVDYHLTCSMPSEGIEAIRWATGYLGDHPARDQQRVEIMLDIAQARMLTVQWKRDAVLQLARRASEQATQIGETRFEMQALTLLGWALEGKGDYAQAMTCLQQALAYYRQQDDREMQARTLLRTGTIFWRLNQPQQARARYQEAHDLFKALNDPVGQASSLQGLGLVFAQQWQYTQALACYHQAYDLDRAAGQKAGMVALLGNMGSIYGRTSEYARAISLYQEALEIEEELGNLGRSGLWLSNMGEMYLQLDDLEKAGEHLERGIAALRADGDLQDLVRVLILQAELSLRLNDLEAVETTVAEAMQLATRLGAENFLFAGRVLRARLSAAHQDVAHALKQLSELLDADRSEEEQAELYFRMWELDRDEEKRQNAMVLYAALSERFPDMVYHQRLKAMENQPDAP